MHPVIGFLSLSCFLVLLVDACNSYLAVHEIVSAEGGVMVIDDEFGQREIKATVHAIGACATSFTYKSGTQFLANYSLMGLSSVLGSGQCVQKEISGKLVMDSMQALVIETNGWLLEPQSIDLDDIDSQIDVPFDEAWMDAAAVFGMLDQKIVLPKTHFAKNTLLSSTDFTIPKESMSQMGLPADEWSVPGADFSGNTLVNCPFGKSNPDSAPCRLSASFDSPVNKLVLLYGLKQQSLTQTESAIFLSQLDITCGCRCTSGDAGSRELALPVDRTPGECTRVETTSPRTECDVLGQKWCTIEDSFAFKISGEALPNGRYPCSTEASFSARVLSDFDPISNFVPVI